jgi:long-chain acyl-CoA synthetase
MERIWLKHYPAGVPADIDTAQYPSLVALLEESFAKFRDRKAFICMDKSITYGELDEHSVALGAYLQSKGMAKGARVALMMPNVLNYPVATCAVLRAGYAAVNVNPLYTPRELEHQLKDSGAEAIIVLENFASVVQQVIAKTQVKHVIVASMGDMLGFKGMIVNLVVRRVKKMVPAFSLPGAVAFNDALSAGRSMKLSKPTLGPDDVAFNIRAAPPASPRAQRCSIATSSPTCCRTTPGCSRRSASRRMWTSSSSSARCRSIISSR